MLMMVIGGQSVVELSQGLTLNGHSALLWWGLACPSDKNLFTHDVCSTLTGGISNYQWGKLSECCSEYCTQRSKRLSETLTKRIVLTLKLMLVPWISEHASYRNNIESFTTPVSVDGIGCFDVKHPPGTMSCYYSSDVSSFEHSFVYISHMYYAVLTKNLHFSPSTFSHIRKDSIKTNTYVHLFVCLSIFMCI